MAMVSRMGDTTLATHAVVWQIWSVVSYFVDGFAHAAETLVGNALGAGNRGEALAYGRRCMVWGSGIGLMFALGYGLGMGQIASIFSDHDEVVSGVVAITVLVSLIQPLSGAVYILDGILIGANDTRFLFIAMAVGAFGVYLPVILLARGSELGLVGVWVAYNMLMISRFGLLWIRFRGSRWYAQALGHFA
jgi:Na+-driven multidrug efflux pump